MFRCGLRHAQLKLYRRTHDSFIKALQSHCISSTLHGHTGLARRWARRPWVALRLPVFLTSGSVRNTGDILVKGRVGGVGHLSTTRRGQGSFQKRQCLGQLELPLNCIPWAVEGSGSFGVSRSGQLRMVFEEDQTSLDDGGGESQREMGGSLTFWGLHYPLSGSTFPFRPILLSTSEVSVFWG